MPELYGVKYSREDLLKRVGVMEQIAGVRIGELADGVGRGIRTAEFFNGSGLHVNILIDRGLDIYNASYDGIPLSWISATGPTHPSYFEASGLGWRRSFFGGLLLTCGLTTIGAPSVDQGEALGLHGRVSNLPASCLKYGGEWQGDTYTIYLEGEVREAVVFGENLLLHRRIEGRLGEAKISVFDTVTNEGYQSAPHMMLYHINAGFPVVDKDAQLLAASSSVVCRDSGGEDARADDHTFSAPIPGFQEQVFFHEMVPASDGYVTVAVVNPGFGSGRGLGLYVHYRQRELRCFNEWKMMGEGIYSVGMEPATNFVLGRAEARRQGTLQILEPGEQRKYHLELGVVSSPAEIEQLKRRTKPGGR